MSDDDRAIEQALTGRHEWSSDPASPGGPVDPAAPTPSQSTDASEGTVKHAAHPGPGDTASPGGPVGVRSTDALTGTVAGSALSTDDPPGTVKPGGPVNPPAPVCDAGLPEPPRSDSPPATAAATGPPAPIDPAQPPPGSAVAVDPPGPPAPAALPGSDQPVDPAAAAPQSTDSPGGTVDQQPGPARKNKGGSNTLKPETDTERAEFSALWRNQAFTNKDLQKRYRCGERTLQRWATEFNLVDRKTYRSLAPKAQNVVRSAEIMAQTLDGGSAQAVIRAQLPGGILDPRSVLSPSDLDPHKDEQVENALVELRDLAEKINGTQDLAGMHRQAIKVFALVTSKSPLHTWDGLGAVTESLVRALAMSRKIEADIPEGKGDPVAVRREAAASMMRELREVLSPDEQQALGKLIAKGADLIQARREADQRNGPAAQAVTVPSAMTEPLGAARPARNAG